MSVFKKYKLSLQIIDHWSSLLNMNLLESLTEGVVGITSFLNGTPWDILEYFQSI